MHYSRIQRSTVSLPLVLVCGLNQAWVSVASGQVLATCGFLFHAQVYSGPHTGLVLSGNLQLAIDASGSTNAIVQTDDGNTYGAVGQVSGRNLALLISYGNGAYLSAVGTADDEIRDCHFGVIFGPLVGPDLDDSGSWGPHPPCEPYPGCRPTPQ
jgi:hypothetical protein